MQSTSINMQRKSGFPVANCSIKMPDRPPETALIPDGNTLEEDHEHQQKRQLLINFGHSQWGFNNWSWAVTKQELDFVEMTNGKYSAGVVAFVSVTVKSFDIHRENIGYATSNASSKGFAIYKSRKCAVTNALRETLLSFGGTVATELLDLLESQKPDLPAPPAPRPPDVENNPNVANHPTEIKNLPQNTPKNPRKEDVGVGTCAANRLQHAAPPKNAPANAPRSPPTARAVPTVPRVPRPPLVRPNSNVSFVLQPVMGAVPYGAARLPGPPPMFPNYCEYPWHFAYEQPHGNVNLNFNLPPKNLVVNSRGAECRAACRPAEGEPLQYAAPPQAQGCWIKPTIFYDGFWTEQKVKKWVAEQVEKQFPEDAAHKAASPVAGADAPKA